MLGFLLLRRINQVSPLLSPLLQTDVLIEEEWKEEGRRAKELVRRGWKRKRFGHGNVQCTRGEGGEASDVFGSKALLLHGGVKTF